MIDIALPSKGVSARKPLQHLAATLNQSNLTRLYFYICSVQTTGYLIEGMQVKYLAQGHNSRTPSGNKTTTFEFQAQFPNQYTTLPPIPLKFGHIIMEPSEP